MEKIKFIKSGNGGCKLMSYQGMKFWINSSNTIMWCEDWDMIDRMIGDGLIMRNFYPQLYGHTEYQLLEAK